MADRATRYRYFGWRHPLRRWRSRGCLLSTYRRFDPETDEYVYDVVCYAQPHYRRRRCPMEHEMLRTPR